MATTMSKDWPEYALVPSSDDLIRRLREYRRRLAERQTENSPNWMAPNAVEQYDDAQLLLRNCLHDFDELFPEIAEKKDGR